MSDRSRGPDSPSTGSPNRRWWLLVGLFVLLVGVVALPAWINLLVHRISPPEPRVYPLPKEYEGRPWIYAGARWRFIVDRDDDGEPDCFVRAGSGREFFTADGSKARQCVGGVVGLAGGMRGALPMDDRLRRALAAAARFKAERGWLAVSTADVDRDGEVDCVLDRFGGLIARSGPGCPHEEISIPAELVDHERRGDLEELFALEEAARAAFEASLRQGSAKRSK